MTAAHGYAATAADAPLTPYSFERRALGPSDIEIEIRFCGICHSDLHTARNEWGHTTYPIVVGHEIVGEVTAVGSDVTGFAVGGLAGVGCLVDSCRECGPCRSGDQHQCEHGRVLTYSGIEKETGRPTAGGYSNRIVVDEAFALRISPEVDLAATAPLLCAGITTYSPLREYGVGPGSSVGVVGLGGLGHMAVKIARALGATVTLFTTSPGKAELGRSLGADRIVVSTDPEAMSAAAGGFDVIIDTVAAAHDLNPYLGMLRTRGVHVLLGVPPTPHPPVGAGLLVGGRRHLTGSNIGGIRETQEMLDFCAEHGITADIETIAIGDVNEAYERMVRNDVRFRFVIDLATLPAPAAA